MRDFPLSDHKDIVDSFADGYNESYERLIKGLVVTNFKPQRNLVAYSKFAQRFPFYSNERLLLKIPPKWSIYAALKISSDASRPTCGILTARAAENARLGEKIFVVSEYKKYDGSYENLFKWLSDALQAYCAEASIDNTTVWLHPDSAHFQQTIIEKLNVNAAVFGTDDLIGLAETNWYLMPTTAAHEFNRFEQAAGMYWLVEDSQISEPLSELGLYHARQEAATWGYNDKGEPTRIGAVLDCLRMCVAEYSTFATPLSEAERYHERLKTMLPPQLQSSEVELPPTPEAGRFSPGVTMQMNEILLRQEMRREGEFMSRSPFDDDDNYNYEDPFDISGGW
jgi:hypothetical protein